ncbi:MAG TPA: hypothetical protein VKZ95_01965 [Sphingobacteriaceae bacterium]|nr:hypothetical protein [Sphingobacteriaceae bacterium]
MSDKSKKIYLAVTIIVPFMLYCVYYYSQMIKKAPFRSTDFESFVLKYGEGDDLINQYDSKTGTFQYLNQRDSLIHTVVKLRKDDLLYLHYKAAELGFWNLPDELIMSDSTEESQLSPHFYLEMNYKEKSKSVLIDARYKGNSKMYDAAKSVINVAQQVIKDAEDR